MATFYIDYGNAGSNLNPGTKSSPWKTHPYMDTNSACTVIGSGPSYPTHTAGDQFIFKGGVTWPAACFQMLVTTGGTTGSPDYYGVDQTWFAGTSFTRPLFDMNYVYVGNAVVNFASGVSNVIFDNFEIYRQLINVTNGYTGTGYAFRASGATRPITIKNCYMHDWATNGPFQDSSYGDWGAGCIGGGTVGTPGIAIMDSSTCSDANGYFIDKNGVRHNGLGFDGACENCYEVKNSTFHDTGAACFSVKYCHDNHFFNINADAINQYCNALGSGCHGQVIENDNPIFQMYVYNNYIHGNTAAEIIGTARGDSVFNNVIWGNGGSNGNSILLDSFDGFGSGQTTSVYNNTIDCNGGNCVRFINRGIAFGTANIQGNHWINSTTPINTNGVTGITGTQTPNVLMTSTQAAAQGYNSANKYIPTQSGNGTVHAGVDLHTLCSGSPGFAALCTDPESAPWFGGTGVARPNGLWDAGAYQFPTSGTTPPTVALTSPPAGTVSGTQTLTLTCSPASPNTISQTYFQIDSTTFGATGSTSPYSLTWDTTTASNAVHSIAAFCVDSASLSNSASETVTVSNNMPGCFVSSNNWSTNQSFTTQTGQFVVVFTVKPNALALDEVVGLSSAPAAAYTDLAAIIRFNASNNIDVRNAGTYQADNVVSYTAGTVYAFSLNVNVLLHTYSVQLTSPSSVSLATNYAFRSEQSAVSSLSYVNMQGSATPNTAQFCNLVLNPSTAGPGGSTAVGSAQRFTVTLF